MDIRSLILRHPNEIQVLLCGYEAATKCNRHLSFLVHGSFRCTFSISPEILQKLSVYDY